MVDHGARDDRERPRDPSFPSQTECYPEACRRNNISASGRGEGLRRIAARRAGRRPGSSREVMRAKGFARVRGNNHQVRRRVR